MSVKDIPIAIWAPPYSSLAKYISKESQSGYNSDGSRSSKNCTEHLMTLVLGKNRSRVTFEDNISTAKLISSDVSFFSPVEPDLGDLEGELEQAFMVDVAQQFQNYFEQLDLDSQIKTFSSRARLHLMFWNAIDLVGERYQDKREKSSLIDASSQELLDKYRRAMLELYQDLSAEDKNNFCLLLISFLESFYCFEDIQKHRSSHLIFSRNDVLGSYALPQADELSTSNVLGILAASGLSLGLPYIGEQEHDVLDQVREEFRSPLEAYIASLCELAEQAQVGIKNGDYSDVQKFADEHIEFKIRPALKELDQAIIESRIKSLKKVAETISEKGAELVSSALTGNIGSAISMTLEVTCKSLLELIPDQTREAKFPMATYIYSVKKKL